MLDARHRRLLWGLLLIGAALRLLGPAHVTLSPDASRFALVGRSLALGQGFSIPTPDATGALVAVPDHHVAPLWPTILSLVYRVFGYSPEATAWTGVVVGLAAIAVVGLATRRILGPDAGLAAATLVAVYPRLVFSGPVGNSEDLSVIFFALTLMSVLLSLQQPRWMVAAGAFAALSFLTRAAAGSLFIVAGLLGLAWRLAHRGRGGVLHPAYLGGAALFLGVVAAWTTRNLLTFWDGSWSTLVAAAQTNDWSSYAQSQAWEQPGAYLGVVARQVFVFALVALIPVGALWPLLRRAASRGRVTEEATSGLWLAIGVTALMGVLIGAAFTLVELDTFSLVDHERYLVVALVPLAWLALREVRAPREANRFLALCAFLLVFSVAAFDVGITRGTALAGIEVAQSMQPGDSVSVRAEPWYFTLAYFVDKSPVFTSQDAKFTIVYNPPPGASGEWFGGSPFVGAGLLARNDTLLQHALVQPDQ